MPQPDMSRQYRLELRQIDRDIRAVDRAIGQVAKDANHAYCAIDRLCARVDRAKPQRHKHRWSMFACSKTKRAIARICQRHANALKRTRARLVRRASILEGRLD